MSFRLSGKIEERQFLALLRLSVSHSTEDCLWQQPIAWEKIFDLATKQMVVGLCLTGIKSLAAAQAPDEDMLLAWIAQLRYIQADNLQANESAQKAVSYFYSKGLKGVVLKGQGIGSLYPDPSLRSPGDVDYWVLEMPSENLIQKVLSLAIERKAKKIKPYYHHCRFGSIGGVDVEVHWRPSWFYCPWLNNRFMRFCEAMIPEIEAALSEPLSELPTPTLSFNRVYILVHLYRHLFLEGIGFRQLIDYYMVLKAEVCTETEKERTMWQLKRLGMERFASAVMYLLHDVLGLPEEYLLCPRNERDGLFLLEEMMRSGNMGHHDARLKRGEHECQLSYSMRKLRRNMQLFRFGPEEVMCTPFWRVWHYYYWMRVHRA